MLRRTLLKSAAAAIASGPIVSLGTAHAEETPGVTTTEIKIGQTMLYSGPNSSYSLIGRLQTAFFSMVNEQGGINGRKINFISLDDGYSPPRTVEQTRRLVEQEKVAFLFNSTGTPTNTAVQKYLNERGVPQLFVATGADKWGNYKQYPWTMGWQPSYRTEAQIYAKHILAQHPGAKIGVVYQNDDFGKDYLLGIKDVLGDKFDRMVNAATYEVTDPTLDSQIVSMQSAGVDTLILGAVAKFVAQAIRKVYDIGWKPLFIVSNVSTSVATVMRPAGEEKGAGIVSTFYIKDPTDPAWDGDPGMAEWRAFMNKYMPNGDLADGIYVYSYGASKTLMQVLRQCGDNFSRENIMKQATNLHDLEIPVLLPAIRINTSPSNYHPIRQMQLARWSGKTWQRFGEVIEGSGA